MGGYKDGEWEWNLSWRRPLFDNEITMAVNFLKDVERSVIQQNGRDAWVWMADPKVFKLTPVNLLHSCLEHHVIQKVIVWIGNSFLIYLFNLFF